MDTRIEPRDRGLVGPYLHTTSLRPPLPVKIVHQARKGAPLVHDLPGAWIGEMQIPG
ncbi:MAG: hypothetical protein JRJ09_16710 [Deltaproteobacteria bacterium]|nr:hypothetical protein [Deltaproteobacteria bacterium]MBW2112578.1 hypothetical protein [Deltaproteobacteria bacterium]MBW2354791.1 hypothetical protein [Deltaproteobacteria bacterium]